MQKPKLIVAGYGSWAKADNNPAQEVALEMGARKWQDCSVLGLNMAVNSATLADDIGALLAEHQPDAWIGVGVSSSAIIEAEMVGINWRDFDVPDVSGQIVRRHPIMANAPAAYNATLPNAQIVEAIRATGIPAGVSFHAGTHLCNQMLYTSAHLVEQHGLRTLTGFIHVPQTPANIAGRSGKVTKTSSMSIEHSAQALAVCIETTAKTLREAALVSA